MKKFLVMPDSFKGTMNAAEVCDIIEQGLQDRFPDAHITKVPLADGGEGTVDSYLHTFTEGQKVFVKVTGQLSEKRLTAITEDVAIQLLSRWQRLPGMLWQAGEKILRLRLLTESAN